MPTATMIVRSGAVVMTAVVAVVVRDLAIVIAAADHRLVVMAPEARLRAAMVLVVASARVAKGGRVVMVMIAVVRRVDLVIVIAEARRSASGWRFRRMCRS